MENNNEEKNKILYRDMKGTGPISSVVFLIILTFLMWILSHIIK